MAAPIRFISLFSGIGGLDFGLERAGMQCVAQVENNTFCQKLLKIRYPEVPKFGDINIVRGWELPECDAFVGGFPCTDLSWNGKGAGLKGKHSGLWYQYARLVGEVRPRYVIVENVPALLRRGMGTVLGDLAALGYDAEWDCIPAAAVGAPHLRDRLFIVAYAKHARLSGRRGIANVGETPLGTGISSNDIRRSGKQTPAIFPNHEKERLQRLGETRNEIASPHGETRIFMRGSGLGGQWQSEPNVGRVANGIPAGVDRRKGLGNAVVPQVGEYIGRCVVAHNERYFL